MLESILSSVSEPWLALSLIGFLSILSFSQLRAWAFCSGSLIALISLLCFPDQSSEHLEGFLSFELNPIRQFFGLIIAGLGLLVGLYSHRYMAGDSSSRRFFGLLALFQFSCLLLIYSNHSLLFATAWELTSLSSFLLIGFNLKEIEARKGAFQAFLVTGLGGLCLFGALTILSFRAGTYRIDEIISSLSQNPGGPEAFVVVLLLLAVMTKSAQFPFHFWLPGAMKAPTPVSAYLHSATLVKLGLFFAALFWPVLQLSTLWHVGLSGIGLVTFAYGAVASVFYKDLKAGLAHTTLSQLGLILVCFAQRDPAIFYTGLVLTLAHALYKSCLFLSVGVIAKWTRTQNITELSGLMKSWPAFAWIVGLSCFSMAGLPPSLGFLSKELSLELLFGNFQNQSALILTWTCLLLGSLFTIVFAFLFFTQIFLGDSRRKTPGSNIRIMGSLLWPLPLLGLFLGLLPSALRMWWRHMGNSELKIEFPLSHGFTPILAISLGLILSAAFITYALINSARYRNRTNLPAWLARLAPRRLFSLSFWNGLDFIGERLSQFFDFLSDRRALLLSLFFVCCFMFPALQSFEWPQTLWFENGYWQLSSILFCSAGIALLAFYQKNIGVQIFLIGFVGYLVAFAFAVLEAPDLVLTQVLVESASLILLVLAFKASKTARKKQARSLGVSLLTWAASLCISVCLVSFFVYTSPVSQAKLSSLYFFENAVNLAGGRNLVNVIIVDFRALDTLGEISVLALAYFAALGFTGRCTNRKILPKPHPQVTIWMKKVGRLFYLALILASLWFLLRGHHYPGGGFIGGLLAALALFIRMMLFSKDTYSVGLCCLGLVLSYFYAIVPPLLGEGEFFESLPTLVGPSSLIFDAGVYLTVAGSVAGLLKLLLIHLSERTSYWGVNRA